MDKEEKCHLKKAIVLHGDETKLFAKIQIDRKKTY